MLREDILKRAILVGEMHILWGAGQIAASVWLSGTHTTSQQEIQKDRVRLPDDFEQDEDWILE